MIQFRNFSSQNFPQSRSHEIIQRGNYLVIDIV